jgi:hypothetical protein
MQLWESSDVYIILQPGELWRKQNFSYESYKVERKLSSTSQLDFYESSSWESEFNPQEKH